MFRSLKNLEGVPARAVDGEIGVVDNFFIDADQWSVRYAVVETGDWLDGRRVLLSPSALGEPDPDDDALRVNLRREQVRFSPTEDNLQIPSRRYETDLHAYYEWPIYWDMSGAQTGMGYGSLAAVPGVGAERTRREDPPDETETETTPNLRSLDEVLGYTIQARDGEIGSVDDFIVNDEDWNVLYLIVDTGGWLPGKKVLVSPQWIEAVRWPEREVQIDLKRETIQDSPQYDPQVPLSRDYESRLYEHYKREKYW